MEPTISRIVHYCLTEYDKNAINRRRADFETARRVTQASINPHIPWPGGAQAHVGNDVAMGEYVPMIVTKCWFEEGKYQRGVSVLNGQAVLDGNDQYWVTSAAEGMGPGTWRWPPRV